MGRYQKPPTLPSWSTYGDYKSSNYGVHALKFSIGSLDVYFSYKTPVAFHMMGKHIVVRQNNWGRTTGKHLNWIDGGAKATRISGAEFEKQFTKAISKGGAP